MSFSSRSPASLPSRRRRPRGSKTTSPWARCALRLPAPRTRLIRRCSATTARSSCAQNVYEGVLGVNDKAQIVPAVAKSYTVSPNGLVYTFHLRRNVRFQNGDPVTASGLRVHLQPVSAPGDGVGYELLPRRHQGRRRGAEREGEDGHGHQGRQSVHVAASRSRTGPATSPPRSAAGPHGSSTRR